MSKIILILLFLCPFLTRAEVFVFERYRAEVDSCGALTLKYANGLRSTGSLVRWLVQISPTQTEKDVLSPVFQRNGNHLTGRYLWFGGIVEQKMEFTQEFIRISYVYTPEAETELRGITYAMHFTRTSAARAYNGTTEVNSPDGDGKVYSRLFAIRRGNLFFGAGKNTHFAFAAKRILAWNNLRLTQKILQAGEKMNFNFIIWIEEEANGKAK